MATWVWSPHPPGGSPFRIGQFPEDENGCWNLRNRGGGAPPRGTSSATKPIMSSGSICSSSGGVDMNQTSNSEAGDTFFAQNPQVFSYVKLFGGYCYNPRHVVVVRWFLLAGCFRTNIPSPMWRTQNHGDVGQACWFCSLSTIPRWRLRLTICCQQVYWGSKNPSFSPQGKNHIYRHISPSYFGWFAKYIHKPLGVTKSDGVNVHPPCLFSWCFLWKKSMTCFLKQKKRLSDQVTLAMYVV